MLAPIIAGLAIGGFLLYTLSGGEKGWKSKKVGPGTYYITAKVTPPNTARVLTQEQFRAVMSGDPNSKLLMIHYVPDNGRLHLMLDYLSEDTLHRELKGTFPGTQLPFAIRVQTVEKREKGDGRIYPEMPVPLLEGANQYLPPVQAPDNLKNLFANALASGNPDAMQSAADTLNQLGWPNLAGPLETRANQLSRST